MLLKIVMLLVIFVFISPIKTQEVSDECFDCIRLILGGTEQDCVGRSLCGPLYFDESLWRMSGSPGEDFQGCANNEPCAKIVVSDYIRNNTELAVGPNRELECYEQAILWNEGLVPGCDLRERNDMYIEMKKRCPGLRPRAETKYSNTLCETDISFFGTCRRNDFECVNGTYHDGLCNLPAPPTTPSSGPQPPRRKNYHSCCIEDNYSGYDASTTSTSTTTTTTTTPFV